jgi:hypothetical protein
MKSHPLSVWLGCRAKLWRASVPEQAPVASDVDWESLGKGYQLAGGSIKQAVVRAATQAALRIEVSGYPSLQLYVHNCLQLLRDIL